MEFSTQCPVCEKYLEGSFEATTRHVNMCMDEKQSFKAIDVSSSKITSAAINEKRTFKYCPICFKFFKVTARHLKSCRKVAGIDTKDLIISCGTGPSKPTNQKANKKGAKENKKGKVDRTLTKLNTRGLAKSRKKIVKSNGDLTKLSIKEKKELIRNRIDLIMSNIVCPNNFVSNYFQNELPYLWTLSSLNGTQIKYVVDGFERFCSESQEITDKNETFSFIENFPVPVKETNQEKANTEDHIANISTDSVSSNLSEDKCFDTTANTGMLELPDLTFSTPDKMNDQFDIFAKSDRDSPDIPSSQPVPKSIYA